jgi:hypothetical protein
VGGRAEATGHHGADIDTEGATLMSRKIRTKVVAGAAALALGAGVLAGLGPVSTFASSHREAPLTSADPQIDQTDLYVFTSPDAPNTVTFVSSWIPFEEPAGGPNFYLWSDKTRYDINVDNDGDARADIIYRWTFDTKYRDPNSFIYNNGKVTSLTDPNLLIRQTYDLTRIKDGTSTKLLDNAPVAPSNVGAGSMPDYNEDLHDAATRSVTGGIKSWVGQSDDPFFLDLRIFDLLYGGDLSESGDDTLAGFNVNTMAIQVPKSQLEDDDSVIGVWNTARRPSTRVQKANGSQAYSGGDVQVSRLAMPLVNEVVVPVGAKDLFNASNPVNDGQFLAKVNDPEVPRLVSAVYPLAFPDVPDSNPGTAGVQRDDLVSVFLTGIDGLNQPDDVVPSEMIRLNMDTPLCTSSCSPLGVIAGDAAGFPNGRRLSDDVVDVTLRVAMGLLLDPHAPTAETLGDGVDANDVEFNDTFPYVAYPHSGSDPDVHT